MVFLTGSTHLHITTWVVAIVLFLVAALSSKQSKSLHMVLRVFYILIIITGGALFIEALDYGQGMLYGIKFLLGLGVISMMEMILVKKAKNKKTSTFWILFAIFLIAIFYVGFKLPMGINFLA